MDACERGEVASRDDAHASLLEPSPRSQDTAPADCDGECFICLQEGNLIHLGCRCSRRAHLACAARWYTPRVEWAVRGKLGQTEWLSRVAASCEVCNAPLDQDFCLFCVNTTVHTFKTQLIIGAGDDEMTDYVRYYIQNLLMDHMPLHAVFYAVAVVILSAVGLCTTIVY